jgi:hypothetical protein
MFKPLPAFLIAALDFSGVLAQPQARKFDTRVPRRSKC